MLRWTPLHFAARSKHMHLVRLLLQRGADPRKAAADGFTVLSYVERHRKMPGYVSALAKVNGGISVPKWRSTENAYS